MDLQLDNVFFARSQMAMSLAFHIVFAVVGIAMPLMMVLAEIRWRRSGDPEYLQLARAWSKGTAVFFAVGAVSGTVLSFELGLLFPRFMREAGAVIGMPFSLEGFAFFTEAIFLGVYLYGWERVRPAAHVAAGLGVAASGLASAVFVVIANAWMNAPAGFRVAGGRFIDINPLAAMRTPAALHEVLHMAAAAYLATGAAVAAIHAFALLRKPSAFHAKALAITLAVTAPAAVVQPFLGHLSGHQVAQLQPVKLAAMESQYKTEARAPLRFGGIPDEDRAATPYAIEIPGGLSFLAHNDWNAVVTGLDSVAPSDRPPVITHYAFQLMVAFGMLLAAVGAWALAGRVVRGRWPQSRAFLWATVLCGPLGLLALEAGWAVTEVGRQPWVVYKVLRTADAVTPMPGLFVPFTVFSAVYLLLGVVSIVILRRYVRASLGAAPGGDV